MSDTLYVTPAQVLAAQLAVELSQEDGEEPDEALKAIASAQVLIDESQTAPATQRAAASIARSWLDVAVEEELQDKPALIVIDNVPDATLREVTEELQRLAGEPTTVSFYCIVGRRDENAEQEQPEVTVVKRPSPQRTE
jgi:hypothetical protein